jgi:putative transposase
MPRLLRQVTSGLVWHVTHRCHRKDFLLKFRRDRRRWLYWLFEARRRHDLCILDYIVTRNHVHLLLRDQGAGEIPLAMQLLASRTAQEFNTRKVRVGAFWQGRYHATPVDSGDYLFRCVRYIDLNMVRAGAVAHPSQWPESGYCELQEGRDRYRLIDTDALLATTGASSLRRLRRQLARQVEEALAADHRGREPCWTESLGVGTTAFLEALREQLGRRGRKAEIVAADGLSWLRETPGAYRPQIAPENAI